MPKVTNYILYSLLTYSVKQLIYKTLVIQTICAVPPCKYTGTAHNDWGMLELNAYNRCVSFGDEPMYTLPTSTQLQQQNIIHILDNF